MVKQAQIALGFGVLTVGALLLYIVLKRKKSNKKSSEPSSSQNQTVPVTTKSNTIDETVLEFTLPNIAVPFVVGKNEEILQSIEEATGTKIKFKEEDSSCQICQITGKDKNDVARAKAMIKERAENPPTLFESMLIPSTAGNRVVGLCGEMIEEICNKSEAKVWIERSDNDTRMDTVKLTGTQAQINAAKILIENIVKEDQEILNRNVKINTPSPKKPSSPVRLTQTPEPREVKPPTTELLNPTNSFGQLEVYVSAVAHPSKFFVQIVGPQSAELDLLIDAMTEYYGDEKNRMQHVIANPTLGQLVAARFQDDERWYRAEVVEIGPNAFGDGLVCDLFFLDYGDNQYVLPKDIFALKSDFLSLKYQAIECFLAYVKPNNSEAPNSWPQRANDRFDELTHVAQWKKMISKTVTFRSVVAKGVQIPGVELFDVEEGHDINIGQQLILEGLALSSTTGYFGDLVNSSVLKLELDTPTLQKIEDPTPPKNEEKNTITIKTQDPEKDLFKVEPATSTVPKFEKPTSQNDENNTMTTDIQAPEKNLFNVEPDAPIVSKFEKLPQPKNDEDNTMTKPKTQSPEKDLLNPAYLNTQNNNAQTLGEKNKAQTISADFINIEKQTELNGNKAVSVESSTTNTSSDQHRDVKMWSDLLKND